MKIELVHIAEGEFCPPTENVNAWVSPKIRRLGSSSTLEKAGPGDDGSLLTAASGGM